MKMRSMLIAGMLAAMLGLSAPAQADRDRGQSRWAPSHHHQSRHDDRHWQHQRHDRIRHQAFRRGYRAGYRDHYRHRPEYRAPRYYGPGGYGFNVWLDGVGVSYYESGRYCR